MILFENYVARIRGDTDAVLSNSTTLASLSTFTPAMDAYDLRTSAQNLRDAAAKIESIHERLTNGGQT